MQPRRSRNFRGQIMSRKGDPKALARIDAKRLTREFEWAMEDPEFYSDWRNQIAYYRSMADKLPDQRRQTVEERHDESGKLIGVTRKATPRAELEWQINDAEKAAQAGDIGRYGLHIQAIVTTLHRLELPAIEKALESQRNSKHGRKKRPKRWGALTKALHHLNCNTAQGVAERWKAEPKAGPYQLEYRPGDEKPYRIGKQAWSLPAIQSALSRLKKRQKR